MYPGISGECFAALDTISCNKGICQRDLAKLILKDRANTGRILNSLEEKGFIKRYKTQRIIDLSKRWSYSGNGKELLMCCKKISS